MFDSVGFLIEPDELVKLLGGNAVVIDARPYEDFEKGHIPGAVPFSTGDLFAGDTRLDGLKPFVEAMANRFMIAGVSMDRPVVVYDGDTGARAARELWMLEFLGHRNARMLHGGFNFWKRVGGPVDLSTEIATVRTKQIKPSLATGFLAGIDDVMRRAGTWNYWVIDVRDDAEWAGREGRPCCARRGHVPHAKHIEWTKFLESGRFKPPQAIAALLMQQEINQRHDIALYSHRGARSALAVYALRYAGINSARNFIGAWHEWSSRADLPVEV
jgi:thiosulfate/3-mercaptopyruvate sulfurtransferase